MKSFSTIILLFIFFSAGVFSQNKPAAFTIYDDNNSTQIKSYIITKSGDHIFLIESETENFYINNKKEFIDKGAKGTFGGVLKDAMLIRYNPDGKIVFKKQLWSNTRVTGFSIAEDNAGNILISAGFLQDTLYFDNTAINSEGKGNILLAKLDKTGSLIWHKTIKAISSNYMAAPSIVVDENNAIMLTGLYKGDILFDTLLLKPVNYGVHDVNIFIARYSPEGDIIWAKRLSGEDEDVPIRLYYVANGKYYITGNYYSSYLAWDDDTVLKSSNGFYKLFIASFDKNGNFHWAKQSARSGNPGIPDGRMYNADSTGNFYVTGSTSNTLYINDSIVLDEEGDKLYIVKYDHQGTALWARTAKGAGALLNLIIDKNDNIIITGNFSSDTLCIGNYKLASKGGSDIFLAVLDKTGEVKSAVQFGTNSNESAKYIRKNEASGNYYLAGSFSGEYLKVGQNEFNKFSTGATRFIAPIQNLIPPVITLKGANPVYIEEGDFYTDSGATAFDDIEGDITDRIDVTNNINTAKTGIYFVAYNVEDSFGISAPEVRRTVIVDKTNTIFKEATGQDVKLDIFPVPAKDQFTVSLTLARPQQLKIVMYNASGQLVLYSDKSSQSSGNIQFNISTNEYKAGIYFLQVTAGEKVFIRQLALIK